jgi:hypothetical protein
MAGEGAVLFFVLFIGLAVALRLAAGSWDRQRITRHFQERGWSIQTIVWRPFGRGWFGEQGDRIYEVTYIDRDGHASIVHCKTSMWSGVYITDGVTPRNPLPPPAPSREPSEMERLRRENAELKEALRRRSGPPR